MFFGQSSILGLDIGSSQIKIVEIKKGRRWPRLLKVEVAPTPGGAILDGQIVQPRELAEHLRHLLVTAGIKTKRVVGSIGGKNVITRLIKVPVMPTKELQTALRFEAEKYIPVPINELILDYLELGEVLAEGVRQKQIMLVAVARAVVETYCQVLLGAGLRPVALEIEPLALWRSVGGMGKFSSPEATPDIFCLACLDLGATITNLVICRNKQLQFSRVLSWGGNTITENLMQTFGWDFTRAENEKRSGRVAQPTGLAGDEAVLSTQIRVAIENTLSDLAYEVRRSLDYYRVQARDEGVQKIILCGGTASLTGLDTYLERELGLPVKVGNPLLSYDDDLPIRQRKEAQKIAPATAVALGLGLREVIG
ncbi:MAG: type IV pilus assembly protein PilM [Firmicutes bacterium]|nr:type IV pilus assembly protein PilM [Bacillota bacterium]